MTQCYPYVLGHPRDNHTFGKLPRHKLLPWLKLYFLRACWRVTLLKYGKFSTHFRELRSLRVSICLSIEPFTYRTSRDVCPSLLVLFLPRSGIVRLNTLVFGCLPQTQIFKPISFTTVHDEGLLPSYVYRRDHWGVYRKFWWDHFHRVTSSYLSR